jgi:hypothetical protein
VDLVAWTRTEWAVAGRLATSTLSATQEAGEDCQLECGSGRMDETTSLAPIIMADYIVALLLIAFVVSLDGY